MKKSRCNLCGKKITDDGCDVEFSDDVVISLCENCKNDINAEIVEQRVIDKDKERIAAVKNQIGQRSKW